MGLDWPRLHAALNDLPAALLLVAVLFDLLGAINRRESLRAAGFWCLIAGVIGGGLAAIAGEMAEGSAVHSDAAHSLMETHESMALVVLVLFAILALWRIVRRMPGRQEQTVFTTAAVLGVGLMIFTAKLGGDLVFGHATGIDSQVLQHAIEERQGGHLHEEDEGAPALPDSAKAHAPADTARHRH